MRIEEDIKKLVEGLAIEGTLTASAISVMNEITEKASRVEAENEVLNEKNKQLKADGLIYADKILVLHQEIKDLAKKSNDVIEREKAITILEMTAELQESRVEDHKEMVKLIFKSPVYQKNISGTGSDGGYRTLVETTSKE